MLATLAALVAVQGFVAGILPATLTYAASQMRAGTFAQGAVFAVVELSALPALAALVLADRRGRRSVLLSATAGAVVLSEVGAVVPSVGWLAVTQVAAGALVAAGGIAAIVLAVEEVPDGCRAWSVGVLGMAGGLGAGVPLALLPLVDLGAGGWRWLYVLSVCCLPVVIRSARYLPEGRRWSVSGDLEALLVAGHATSDGGFPLKPRREGPGSNVTAREGVRMPDAGALTAGRGEGRAMGGAGLRRAPGGHRLALLCAGAVLFAIFAVPAGQFQTQFLRDYRHYSPLSISLLEQLSGTLGGLGVLVGGRMADTRGRRPVGVACVGGATLFTLDAYLTHAWLMWASATASQFFLYAAAPVLGVYGAELFTTRARARSAGLVSAASSVGAVAGLVSMGWLASRMGSFVPALALLAAGPAVLLVLLLLAYPESAGRSLGDLSADLAGRASLAGSAIVAAETQN
jgi:MFS family permease